MIEDLLALRRADRLSAQQKLALAVIAQAFTDAADLRVSPAVRNEARRFIAGSAMLNDWCDVAKVDRTYVRDVTARFLRGLFDVVSDMPEQRPVARKSGARRAGRGAAQEQTAARMSGAVAERRAAPGAP
jgi:hypothetical protein